MRLIWTTPEESKATTLVQILSQHAIDSMVDRTPIQKWDNADYGTILFRVWVSDEDRVEESKNLLDEYLRNPSVVIPPKPTVEFLAAPHIVRSPVEMFLRSKIKSNITPKEKEPGKTPITSLCTFLCCLLFILSMWSSPKESNQISPTTLRETLLFDYPKKQELFDSIGSKYGEKALLDPKTLPPEGQKLYKQALNTPAWPGLWDIYANVLEKKPPMPTGIMFEKIREGEIWRAVSPIFLHGDLLHLFFNMIWLIILAPQIEIRTGPSRFLILTLLLAVFSNVTQYIVSGPAFIGFSGVICGYAAFMWTRMKNRPWEGYIVQPGTFAFLLFFVGMLAVLSFVSFFVEVWFKTYLPIGIANSAHISGAIFGFLFGKLDYFRARPEDGLSKKE